MALFKKMLCHFDSTLPYSAACLVYLYFKINSLSPSMLCKPTKLWRVDCYGSADTGVSVWSVFGQRLVDSAVVSLAHGLLSTLASG